jgi:hypothetical protein
MRIWTIHPKYLDTKGLLAAWREGLLAQAVLGNQTRGYRNHPQLRRFKSSGEPIAAIATYLRGVHSEAVARSYNFDSDKISVTLFNGQISCTRDQLLYEWEHLKQKLMVRDLKRFHEVEQIIEPDPHPLFRIIEGGIEDWEIIRRSDT